MRDNTGDEIRCEISIQNEYESPAEPPEITIPPEEKDPVPADPPNIPDEVPETEDVRIEADASTDWVDRDDEDDEDRYDRDDEDEERYDPAGSEENSETEETEQEEITSDWWGTPEVLDEIPTERLPDAFYDELMRPVRDFKDVAGTHWAKEYIGEASARGVIDGYPDGTFLPDHKMNRAQFATILWNMAGRPISTAILPFRDVGQNDWFYPQIAWAYETGCINGMTADEFRPYATITREQAVTILFRYSENSEGEFDLYFYADRDSISPYAMSAVRWALSAGILSGVDDTHLSPLTSVTRAQAATLIVRYIQYIQYLQILTQ